MEKPVAQKSAFLRSMELPRPYKLGDIVEGTVIGSGRSTLYLDLGPRGTGVIYGREFQEEKDYLKRLRVGDRAVGKIVELENEKGYVELSLREAGKQLTWDTLRERKAKEETFSVKIMGANKGGLLAEISGIQAFLPVSQLTSEHYPKVEGGDPEKILTELQKLTDSELEVQVVDLDPAEGKIILSERAKEQSRTKELLAKYQVGDVVEGEITGIVDFGAFVTFGDPPIEGLIHISEIDWQIIEDPSQYVKTGDRLKAKIIDLSNGRVSLSLKALKEDPWKGMEERYKKFGVIWGRVTKLNPFGAFVEVEPKIQGLAHISEFGTRKRMEERLELTKSYSWQILDLNVPEHRMTLRLMDGAAGEPRAQEERSPKPPAAQERQES